MAKSELTKQLEQQIWSATICQGTFGCLEVTIGWFGKERVDYLTYDTKGVFRCYEIKVSLSDFNSSNHNTFVGHLNYYVVTSELYEKVKNKIPKGIGVWVQNSYGVSCVKRATRRNCQVDEQVLKDSMIRSLCREVNKQMLSNSEPYVQLLTRELNYEKSQRKAADRRY